MLKNKLSLLSILIALVFSLVACSGDQQSSTSKEDESSTSNSGETESGKIVIEHWDFLLEFDEVQEAIDNFNASQDNIEVKRVPITRANFDSKMMNAAAAKKLPDIFINSHSRFQAFGQSGIAADITDLIKESGIDQRFFEGSLQPVQFEGKFYGLPTYNNNLSLYYNKDMFAEAGLTEPPKTWDEIREYAKKLTKDGVYGLAMAGSKDEQGTFNFLPWVWQAGADLDTLTSPEGIKAIEFRQTLLNDGSVSKEMLNWQQNDANLQFLSKRAAMQINGSWNVPALNEGADFEWAVAELPMGKTQATVIGGEAIGIGSTSEHKEAAFEFIKFFFDQQNYKTFILKNGNLPSLKAIAEEPEIKNDPIMSTFTAGLSYAKSRAYGPNYPEITSVVQELVQATILGKDPQEIAKKAQDQIIPLLPKK